MILQLLFGFLFFLLSIFLLCICVQLWESLVLFLEQLCYGVSSILALLQELRLQLGVSQWSLWRCSICLLLICSTVVTIFLCFLGCRDCLRPCFSACLLRI